jgi:hypothetical protein
MAIAISDNTFNEIKEENAEMMMTNNNYEDE